MRVLGYLNTCNRYDTTLPLAILSVINQTRPVDKFVMFDDSKEARDIRKTEHLHYLLKLLDQRGIPWEYVWGERKGAHWNHERANVMGYDLAWFIDDDHIAEPTCLEYLLSEMKDGMGAVGGLILQPPASPLPPNAGNKIDDLYIPNIQWFKWSGSPREVEHIYSSFLYRCDIAHHDLRLSSVVFRGETMFTHSLFLKGYKLIVTPRAVMWHLQAQGGIHDQNVEKWQHDEQLFRDWLAFKKTGKKLFVLNGGLGDHFMFKSAIKIPENAVIACCYPDVFKGYEVMSIADAQKITDINQYDVYAWAERHNWKGHLMDAYKKLYEDTAF